VTAADVERSQPRLRVGVLGAGMIATISYGYLPHLDKIRDRVELTAIANAVRATGALEATRELAEQHVQLALDTLAALPAGTARESLETVALASLQRTS